MKQATLPYPGLRPFDAYEADIFFGREQQTDELLEKLDQSRFLALVGPSGCGKSSLARAGLIAGLETGYLAEAGPRWRYAIMRPGSHPIQRLAKSLLEKRALAREVFADRERITKAERAEERAILDSTLRRGPTALHQVLLETPPPAGTNLLLLVDQFEEIFRFRREGGRNEADAFVELLLESARIKYKARIYVAITMRSDYLGDCALFTGLPEHINQSLYLTPRLTREQSRSAIEDPARVFGGEVEPALVNSLLNDLGADPDQLPLLQHLMMRMWTSARPNPDDDRVILTREDFRRAGRLAAAAPSAGLDSSEEQSALSKHANEAYEELNDAQKKIAETLFRRLCEHTPNRQEIRTPASVEEIAEIRDFDPQEVIKVANVFRQSSYNFITPSQQEEPRIYPNTVLDISHESLIRQWNLLEGWAKEEFRSAETYRLLEKTACRWKIGQADYWGTHNLARAQEDLENPTPGWAARYGDDFELSKKFLEASKAEHTRLRKERDKRRLRMALVKQQRVGIAALAALLVIAIAAAIHALNQTALAEDRARVAVARGLPSQNKTSAALVLLEVTDPNTKVATAALRNMAYDRTESESWFTLTEFRPGLTESRPAIEDPVVAVKASSLGSRIVTASKDKARVWDLDKGKQLLEEETRLGLSVVAFSPDGLRILIASKIGTAVIWDSDDSDKLVKLKGHGLLPAIYISVHPSFPQAPVEAAQFSPDGKWVVTGAADRTARIWDAETGEEHQVLRGHSLPLKAVAFSPDGQHVVTGSADGTARLWSAKTGEELRVLRGHRGAVLAAEFNPDGKRILTGAIDRTARLWDAETGEEHQVLQGHRAPVLAVAFSPPSLEDHWIATGSQDRTAWIWDAESGESLSHLRHEFGVTSVSFNPHDGRILTVSINNVTKNGLIKIWNLDGSGNQLADGVIAAFNKNGKQLLTGSKDGTGRILATALPPVEIMLKGPEAPMETAVLSPDGRRVLTRLRDGRMRLFNVDGSEVPFDRGEEDPLGATVLAFGPDSRRIAIGHPDGKVGIWEQNGWNAPFQQTVQLSPRQEQLAETWVAAAFSPDGHSVVTGSRNGRARVWNLNSSNQYLELKASSPADPDDKAHDLDVAALAFSPDGKKIVTGSSDRKARLWDARSGEKLVELEMQYNVSAVAFGPDGRFVTGVSMGEVQVWNSGGANELHLPGDMRKVVSTSFSPDGRWIVTCSEAGTVHVWDADDGSRQSLPVNSPAIAAAFQSNSDQVVTIHQDGSVWQWPVSGDSLQREIRSRLKVCLEPDFREMLGESGETAQGRYQQCLQKR